MRSLLFRIIRRVGFRFGIRIQRSTEIEQLSVPFFIEDAFKDYKAVRVLQIGANDGMSEWDPIAPFYDRLGFSGILFEPQPKTFKRLKSNLDRRPQWTTKNAAVSNQTGTIDFYVVGSPMKSKHPLFCDQISSTIRHEVVAKLVAWGHTESEAEGLTQKISVDSLSFADLATGESAGFDLVAIDAEGMDFKLVRMMFEANIMPKLLIFECSHLNPDERLQIPDLLYSKKYAYYPCGGDIVAKHLDSD